MSPANPDFEFFNADTRFALTAATDNSPATLSGYALVWNVLSTDRGGFVVRLMPNSARFADITRAYWNHNSRDVLGSTAVNTLRLLPDNFGVKVEIDLPNTTAGRDVAELVRRGDIAGMSFSQRVGPSRKSVTTREKGLTIRNDKEFIVDEVTVTAEPGFRQSTIGLKSADVQQVAARFNEGAIRDAHRLQAYRFDQYRLAGAEHPRPAV